MLFRSEAAIQKKVEGQEISLADEPDVGAQVIDLMEALRASLQKKPAAPSAAPKAKATVTATATESRKPPKRAAAQTAAPPKKVRKNA